MQENSQFVGLKELSDDEQEVIRNLSLEQYGKFLRLVPNMEGMVVHIRVYEKESAKKKYAVHVRVNIPSKSILESCKSHDWELPASLHKSFEDIEHQMQHKFKL